MNFEIIEGLTTAEIEEMYNDIVEKDEASVITECCHYIVCTNGLSGYFVTYDRGGGCRTCSYAAPGYYTYIREPASGGSSGRVCGAFVGGYVYYEY